MTTTNQKQPQQLFDYVSEFLATHSPELTDLWQKKDNQKQFLAMCSNNKAIKQKFKDPHKPKRACSAYIYYCNAKRDEIKEKLGSSATTTEITVALAADWNMLKDDTARNTELEIYTELAHQDKIRYCDEMAVYEPPDPATLTLKSDSKISVSKKRTQNSPKRPISAYLYYCKEMRPSVQEELGEQATPTEVMSRLGLRWAHLKISMQSDDTNLLSKYHAQAAEDKARYQDELAQFELISQGQSEKLTTEEPPSPKKTLKIPKPKKIKVDTKVTDESESSAAKKATRKLKSGYVYFCQETRSQVQEQNAELGGAAITKLLATQWKALSDEERAGWKSKANPE